MQVSSVEALFEKEFQRIAYFSERAKTKPPRPVEAPPPKVQGCACYLLFKRHSFPLTLMLILLQVPSFLNFPSVTCASVKPEIGAHAIRWRLPLRGRRGCEQRTTTSSWSRTSFSSLSGSRRSKRRNSTFLFNCHNGCRELVAFS